MTENVFLKRIQLIEYKMGALKQNHGLKAVELIHEASFFFFS